MKKGLDIGMLLGLLLLGLGCATTAGRQSETYPMSYDQTYQTALDALDEMKIWKVIETDQLGGLIELEKGGHWMPRKNAKVIVKRVAPFQTSVELYEKNKTREYENFFNAIDRRVEDRAVTYPT